MYDNHLRLIGKRVSDFLLVLIELFSLAVIRLRRYKRISVQNRRLRSKEGIDPKFQVEGVAPHQPFFFTENWAR